ncbi:MAG: PilC/PilY family type IV pilus protein, partial [Pseudomonadales bacterium]|nr:PilC/PilY family type IV pilus protein [Pseudomonadales bacterium]
FSYSVPTIAMTNVQGAGGTAAFPERKWAAVFGNGYNSTYGFATLFVNFIEDANDGSWDAGDFVKIRTGFGPAPVGEPNPGLPNGLGEPRLIDLDGNGTVDYAYAGDMRGNLFRFDMTSPNPANWTSTRIFRATYSDGTPQPITTQPIVTRNTQADGVVVLIGTGSYFTTTDGTDESIQSIYGIWDRVRANPFTAEANPPTAAGDRSLLVEQEIINLFDETEGALRSLTANEVRYAIGSVTPPEPAVRGWYIDLDPPRPTVTVQGGINPDQAGDPPPGPQFPGERAVRNLDLRGGFLFVNTVIPRDNLSCDVSPGGFGLAINPLTGGAGGLNAANAFDINNDGRFDSGDLVGGNIIAGLRFDEAVPTDSTFIGTRRFTQLSDRTLDIRDTNTGFGPRTGRLSWRELE